MSLRVPGSSLAPGIFERNIKALKIDLRKIDIAPAHCTGHLAFSILRKVFGDQYRFFGLGETLSL